jgi:D-3-phosphoglycerate dehydrogenase
MLGEKHFRQMKKSAVFINTGRGATVDEEALIKALQEGWISHAALDVLEKEPPSHNNPMLGMENVILTPHMAARTHTAIENMSWVVRDVIDVLSGKPARFPAP